MYLSVALLGIYLADASPILAVPAMMAVGALFGLVNAFFVVRLRVAAFIVTLATLFIGRGLALWVTETRMVFYKEQILSLARAEFLGVPWAIWVFAIVFAVAWIVLNHTPFGRQVYAVGENPDAAAKAGINVPLWRTTVYAVSGACAGIAGLRVDHPGRCRGFLLRDGEGIRRRGSGGAGRRQPSSAGAAAWRGPSSALS